MIFEHAMCKKKRRTSLKTEKRRKFLKAVKTVESYEGKLIIKLTLSHIL